ncbi:uncharacterized protein EHS24_009186 [Apiotrichum porosum]|uniref:Major facilitator superfamily (MFS) profile domain-containing protein n=1 Tax=Apiotrichum porosum TaxID=105984 RepID=A0A427XP50_9TREE|nr:uncharacterized protein EHS24_009186 [Apiotrichum porosum]RSH80604.1 hypothetical protein EHS24_009186 [Apiotrichum porosum]
MARFSPKIYTLLCGCFAALGSILFSYDLGVIASVLEAPDFLRTTGLEGKDKQTLNYIGFITSSMLLGAFVGCIPASLIADAFSRRIAITVGAAIFLVGGILQTAANGKGMMMAGRFFAGIAIGQLSLLAPLYQSEISAFPWHRRGVASWIGYGVTKNNLGTALQWRLPLGFQMVPAVPLLFVTLVLPESPRWLMIKGREEESLTVLAQLHSNGDVHDPLVLGEFHEMREKVREEAATTSGWGQIFRNADNLRKVMLGVILQFSVQMTGVSFIQYYAPRVYAAVGYSTETTLLLGSLSGVLGILSQLSCVLFIDKTGRRWPLIIGNSLSGFLYIFLMWISYKFNKDEGSETMARAFVAVNWLWNMIFSACIGPISWAYPVEIMNTAIRAKGTALTSMACWISNFMIGQVSPDAFAAVGWKYYLLFVICGFTNAFVMWALFPETRGRTLEEMDHYFATTHWFVPTAKTDHLDAAARERELISRELQLDTPVDDGKGDVGGEKGVAVVREYAEK